MSKYYITSPGKKDPGALRRGTIGRPSTSLPTSVNGRSTMSNSSQNKKTTYGEI